MHDWLLPSKESSVYILKNVGIAALRAASTPRDD